MLTHVEPEHREERSDIRAIVHGRKMKQRDDNGNIGWRDVGGRGGDGISHPSSFLVRQYGPRGTNRTGYNS